MNCDDATLSLGVYLLGALDDAEREAVEAHLSSCAACRAELAELEGLPAMLAQLTMDDLTVEPLAVPDDLFERVAARARAEDLQAEPSRVVRYRRLTAVAAVVVLIAAGGVGSWAALHSPSHSSSVTATSHVFTATNAGVTMRVTLASQATGTGLAVTVSGLPRDEHCRLIAISKTGERDVAGRWDATYLGQAQETGSSVIPRAQLSQLVLLGTGGKPLVTVAV